MVPFGAIWCHLVPYGAIWFHLVPYSAKWCHVVPCGKCNVLCAICHMLLCYYCTTV